MKTDAQLRLDVIDELTSNPLLDANTIEVAVKGGIATLSGHVTSLPARDIAEHYAQHVAGVRAIIRQIKIVVPCENFRTDFEIQEQADLALEWNALLPQKAIRATVEHATVTLAGAVDYTFQKKAAEGAVRNLLGVRSVVDLVTIEPTVQSDEALQAIERTLRRTVDHSTHTLLLEANCGVVTLRGEVSSWSEREEAERAALNLRGVSDVVNEIMICA